MRNREGLHKSLAGDSLSLGAQCDDLHTTVPSCTTRSRSGRSRREFSYRLATSTRLDAILNETFRLIKRIYGHRLAYRR